MIFMTGFSGLILGLSHTSFHFKSSYIKPHLWASNSQTQVFLLLQPAATQSSMTWRHLQWEHGVMQIIHRPPTPSPSLIVAEWHRQRQRALKWSIWFLMVFASEWATSAQHSSSSQTLEAWLSRTGILIMTGGKCQRWFVTTRVKGKVHKMAVRPGAIHVVWLWQKDKLRMLRF